MKELDLMFALDAVEDDLLDEAESFTQSRRRISWMRFAAIAAVVALLSISVYAIYTETRISYPNDENSWLYRSFEVDGIKYSHVEVEYDLQHVKVKDNAIGFMTDMVDMVSYWGVEEGEWIPYGYGLNHNFESLKYAENFFGLTFDLPEIVRNGKVSKRGVDLLAVPMYPPEGLTAEEAWEHEPNLGGALVTFNVNVGTERVDSMYVKIYLGLTEEFAAVPATSGSFMALDLMGEPEIREIRVNDETFTIVYYPDYPDTSVEAYYVRNGIGYGLVFEKTEEYTGDPIRMIYNHLKDIGK